MVFARSPRPRNSDSGPVDLDRVPVNDLPDTLHEATVLAVNGLKELRTKVAELSADNLRLHAQLATAEAEASTYKHLADENQRERDHYIRFSTELITQMQNARHLFDDCFERAKLALYQKQALPLPAKEPDEPPDVDEPIPTFLTQPNRDTTR